MSRASVYHKVRSALSSGALVRPERCSKCGEVPKKTTDGRASIQAHHHDYSKPLDVEWICAKCHRKETPLPTVMGAPNFGELNGAAKLTETDVLAARRLRAKGETFQSIADRFNVDKRTAMRAIKGELWAHVKENHND